MKSTTARIFSYLICTLGLWLPSDGVFGQIYHVKEMNTEQIKALDREKTVVILPGGILEEHGPYLPSFTDGYRDKRLTEALANGIVEKPGWKVLVFLLSPWAPTRPTTLARNMYSPALTPFGLQHYGLYLWIWQLI